MNIKKAGFLFYFFFLVMFEAMPQASFSGDDLRSDFNRATDLFNKEKYAAAIRLFDDYVQSGEDESGIRLIEAEYYAALSALRLQNPDAGHMKIRVGFFPVEVGGVHGKVDGRVRCSQAHVMSPSLIMVV